MVQIRPAPAAPGQGIKRVPGGFIRRVKKQVAQLRVLRARGSLAGVRIAAFHPGQDAVHVRPVLVEDDLLQAAQALPGHILARLLRVAADQGNDQARQDDERKVDAEPLREGPIALARDRLAHRRQAPSGAERGQDESDDAGHPRDGGGDHDRLVDVGADSDAGVSTSGDASVA